MEGGGVYIETQMSQIKSHLPIFEYASNIYPTVALEDKKNLAHWYDFDCESLSGPHNAHTHNNP